MNKFYRGSLVLLLSATLFASCKTKSESVVVPSDNANENSLEKSQYARRLEMPHLSDNLNCQLLVKTTTTYGVNYIIEWDRSLRAQNWTCWAWTPENNVNPDGWSRSKWKNFTWEGVTWTGDPFQADPELDAMARTELYDYKGSGYDRGHICASQDRIGGPDVNGPTFYLSNMHPQVNAFNSGVWEQMERCVRVWADAVTQKNGTLYVCKGGTTHDVTLNGKKTSGRLYVNPATGKPNPALRMPVPKYFYMALLRQTQDGQYSTLAFWAEHKPDANEDLSPYVISVDELEARTGIDFFCNLPDHIENAVEASIDYNTWVFNKAKKIAKP